MDRRDHIEAMIDAGTTLLGIPIAREWRGAIHFNLEMTLRLAAIVNDFALPDEAEPAPVFRP
jgi:hypothetical protein